MRVETFPHSRGYLGTRVRAKSNGKKRGSQLKGQTKLQFSSKRILVFIVCIILAVVAAKRRSFVHVLENPKYSSLSIKFSEYRKALEPVALKEMTSDDGSVISKERQYRPLVRKKPVGLESAPLFPATERHLIRTFFFLDRFSPKRYRIMSLKK